MRANLDRLRLAACVAVASAATVVALIAVSESARGGGASPLPPDLVTLALQQDDLVMADEPDGIVLRLSNSIANRGTGPLEVFPSAASQNCDGDGDPYNDRDASQRMYADSNATGLYERGVDAVGHDRLFGCMRYHLAHDHWHVLGFALYQLRSERTGELVATTRKLGFCLGDNRFGFAGPGALQEQVYPAGSRDPRGCTQETIQGLSVGWVDVYLYDVPGQAIAVEGLPRGRYCLISRTDPGDLLDELNEDNNVRRTRIALDPKAQRVRKLDGSCRL